MDRKPSRRFGVALSAAALALSLVLPGVASADEGLNLGPLQVSLVKDCGKASSEDQNAQAQCNYQLAQPTGGSQSADLSAENKNVFVANPEVEQDQVNVQKPDLSYNGVAIVKDNEATAFQIVKSGDVNLDGNKAEIDQNGVDQIAKANPEGDIHQDVHTGDVEQEAEGNVVVKPDLSAEQASFNKLFGVAKVDDTQVGGNGGESGKAEGGYGPYVSRLGVDGGDGGSNINVALGLSLAKGGKVGEAEIGNTEASSGSELGNLGNTNSGFGIGGGSASAESELIAKGGDAEAGYGAQADPTTQTAGASGGAWFAVTGNGGNATSGAAGNGAAGTLANANTITGTASGTATAGSINGDILTTGHYQVASSGGNTTTAALIGGYAVNSMTAGISQTGNVAGYSGAVTNNAAPQASLPININQSYNNPQLTMTNTPTQTGNANVTGGAMTNTSGAQTANPFEVVKTGEQEARNAAAQDSFKAIDSFNTRTFDTTVTVTNSGNDESSVGNTDGSGNGNGNSGSSDKPR